MPLETERFDAADYLDSDEAVEAFLQDALDTGDAGEVARAVTVIARARARAAALTATEPARLPEFGAAPAWPDILEAIRSLGLRLTPVTVKTAA
ncbi:MAG: hypothetical protein Q8S03_02805 [Brevundimonas sp.]|uniref:hypothetical protein n=1 Tax=Brevundimonas sp. TaxID=1871086 RepID=UPI0027364D8D|nr:hypothetical protein [Brevundimonas sp.]MDP3403592.1 hypothetical protein [Brevundimonas sp.]